MPAKRVTLEEARRLIHDQRYVGPLGDRLLIPVPGTTRWVGVRNSGNGGMSIYTSRPGYILPSQALTVWGDQPLEWLSLNTARSGGDYWPPHTATREEWGDLLHHLPRLMPTMTGRGLLDIDQSHNPSTWYDEVLGGLPPALPHLVAERGVRVISLYQGVVSARSVVSFMSTLHQEGWPVEEAGVGCKVGTPGGEVRVGLSGTRVVGSRTTLEEARRLNPSPLHKPRWQEREDGDIRYEAMVQRWRIADDFNKALEEGVAETCRGRVVLLGRGGVGKTSVKNALLGLDFSSNHDITDMLDVQYVTIDSLGTWKPLDDSAMRKHDEHYLVSLAMQQHNKLKTVAKDTAAAASMSQDEGATAGIARLEGQKKTTSKKGKTGGGWFLKAIKKLFWPKVSTYTPVMVRREEVPAEVEGLLQEGKELEKKDSMYVWDFAGQLVYYTVHQLFLTERTVILLVTDGSNDLEAFIPPEYAQESDFSLKTEKEYVEYFLKTGNIWVRSERDDSEAPRLCQPPHVFILLNKADLVSPEVLRERLETVRKLVKATPAFDDMVREVFPFSSNPAPEAEGHPQLTSYEESCLKLKDCLQRVKQDFVDKVPIKWLRLKNKLQEKPHISFEEAVEVADSLHIKRDKVKSVLQYFHQHRELVYWDTEGCRDFVVCQPNWLIYEMRKVISVKENQLQESHSFELSRLLEFLTEEKILNESLAEELWKENHKVMIKIMQKYLLLLPWTEDKHGQQQYLVPCLLETMNDTDLHSDRQDIPPINFYLQDKVMPIGLTSRLVTLLATREGWNDGDEMPTIFFNGAKFLLKEKNTFVSISLKETLWKPCIGEEWKDKRERMKEQTVIQVGAGLTSEINKEVKVDASRCLNRARETIEAGIRDILSMINVSQSVVTAEESPCKHKLLPPETRVCNICMKSYGPEVYGAWFGQELTLSEQDTTRVTGGRCLMTGNLSQVVSQIYQDMGKDRASIPPDFVVDEKKLNENLDQVIPELLELVKVDPSLVAELKAHGVLGTAMKEKLKNPVYENNRKVDFLLDHITRNVRGWFLPLLLALEATNQTGAIAELDTKDIRDCLNLENKGVDR